MTDASCFDAIRAGYDTIAEEYFKNFPGGVPDHPVDKGMLGAFVELVRAGGGGKSPTSGAVRAG